MSEAKRKRGRPKGSGGRDDNAVLRRIVAHMVATPAMKRATAIRLVCDSIGESDSHRLYRKLRTQGAALHTEELERVRQNQTHATEAAGAAAREGVPRFRAMVDMGVMPAQAADSPFMKALREMVDSPMATAMREVQAREAAFTNALREMVNSPMATAMREVQAREAAFTNALRGIA
jgi:hypothetical protein